MGMRLICVGFLVLLQLCPVRAQAQPEAVEDASQTRTETRNRVRAISDALFLSGLTFTALETAHKREVCAAGVCERMRRRGYSWGALAGYAGATVGYLWLVGSRRDTVSIGLDRGGALSARVSW